VRALVADSYLAEVVAVQAVVVHLPELVAEQAAVVHLAELVAERVVVAASEQAVVVPVFDPVAELVVERVVPRLPYKYSLGIRFHPRYIREDSIFVFLIQTTSYMPAKS